MKTYRIRVPVKETVHTNYIVELEAPSEIEALSMASDMYRLPGVFVGEAKLIKE